MSLTESVPPDYALASNAHQPNLSGHMSLSLRLNGQDKTMLVHQLVLLAFVGPCPDGLECCHFPDRNGFATELPLVTEFRGLLRNSRVLPVRFMAL